MVVNYSNHRLVLNKLHSYPISILSRTYSSFLSLRPIFVDVSRTSYCSSSSSSYLVRASSSSSSHSNTNPPIPHSPHHPHHHQSLNLSVPFTPLSSSTTSSTSSSSLSFVSFGAQNSHRGTKDSPSHPLRSTALMDTQRTEIRNGRKINLLVHDNPEVLSSSSSATNETTNEPAIITLFFVHGSMAHHGQFTPQLQYFQQSKYVKRIVAYDAYGCGKSEKPENSPEAYSEKELLSDLIILFQSYANPHGKNIVIGHSFGSNLALCLAQHVYDNTSDTTPTSTSTLTPETSSTSSLPNIHGLVLIGTAAERPGNTWLFHLPEWFINAIRGPLGAGFLSRAFHRDAPAHLLEESKAHNRTNPLHVIRPFYQQVQWNATTVLARQKSTEDLTKTVNNDNNSIPSPSTISTDSSLLPLHLPATCVIVGVDDQLTPVSASQAVAEAIPRSTLHIIENASHMVMLEQPGKVNALIEGHIIRVLKETMV